MTPLMLKRLMGGGVGYLDILAAMSNPSAAMPVFIEGWALNSFFGINGQAPTVSGIPTDSMGQLNLSYTVSGTAGSSTLSISTGDQSKGAGYFGAVVQHDDGTYGLYGISNMGSGVCTTYPNIRSTITNKPLKNVNGTVNGQHYTDYGYKALARKIYGTTLGDGYRLRYAAKWDSSTGLATDWTAIGGLGAGQKAIVISNNYIAGAVRSSASFVSRGRRYLSGGPISGYSGKGMTKTFTLGGSTGYLEAFVSCAKIDNAAGSGFYPFNVTVVVDSVVLLNKNYTENDGLQRVIVPYAAGNSGTITVTYTDETPVYGANINIGDVTWWAYDRSQTWANRVIDKNDTVVIIGDSWTTYYPEGGSGVDGILGTELQAAMAADGGTGTVTSVGVGGTDAEYSISQFATKVVPLNPTVVMFVDFTNDHNSYGDAGYERWLTAMYKLGRLAQDINARPVFLMPLPTASIGQSIGHGIWADELGAGLPNF